MTETDTNTDQNKFNTERKAAQAMRDDLFFLVGWTQADQPEIAKRLEAILKQHAESREQNWF